MECKSPSSFQNLLLSIDGQKSVMDFNDPVNIKHFSYQTDKSHQYPSIKMHVDLQLFILRKGNGRRHEATYMSQCHMWSRIRGGGGGGGRVARSRPCYRRKLKLGLTLARYAMF